MAFFRLRVARAFLRLMATTAGALALGAACSGRSVDPKVKSCARDADCAAGQRCAAAADQPVKGTVPCAGRVQCTDVRECVAAGQVCAPGWQLSPDYDCGQSLCAPPCTAASCPPDATCGDDGRCVLTRCDASGAAACPEFWRCDPEAALTASHDPSEGASVYLGGVDRHMERGCVREPCGSGTYACMPAWACRPGETTNPAGCIPERCEDTGHCADDAQSVCRTLAKHPDKEPPDVNGCVIRTCDDGSSCDLVTPAGVNVGECSYAAPDADYRGCRQRPCVTADDCFSDYVCDHTSPQADPWGCRNRSCTEGYVCPPGFICDPKASSHDAADCTTPEFASTGGASGAGGSGGASPSSGGATNAAGGVTSATGGATSTGGTTDDAGGSAGSGNGSLPRGECVAL